MDCNKCNCKDVGVGTPHCDDLHKLAKDYVEFGAKVINDTEVCNLPTQISKLFLKTRCVLDNIINNLCDLMKRADCLETKQVHTCENIKCEDTRIDKLNLLISNINGMYERNNATLLKDLDTYAKALVEVKELRKQEQERYVRDKAKYDRDLAEAQASTKLEGYASQVISQKFTFANEGATFISANKTTTSADEWNRYETVFKPSSDKIWLLNLNETLEVTYGLQKSYFNGTKLAKAIFYYTPTSHTLSGTNFQALNLGDSPNYTINWNGMTKGDRGRAELKVRVAFYDDKGNHVSVNGGYIAFNSLNSTGDTLGNWEGVKDFKGEFIYINGSSITDNNGIAYSKTDNRYTTLGFNWDGKHEPKFYYGGIIGKITSEDLEYTNVLNDAPWLWFQLDTDIASKVVPVEPLPPKKIDDPIKPEGIIKEPIPQLDANCIDALLPCDYCLGDKKIR